MSRSQAGGLRANHAASSASAATSQPASQTLTDRIHIPPSATLRLRAEAPASQQLPQEDERHVQWSEDVVNNEGMGKKSSKVCCIYHKPRAVGESSDEDSSSDSSSDEDSDNSDDGAARPAGKSKDNCAKRRRHKHVHDKNCSSAGDGQVKGGKKAANAYERLPKNT